jgi:hypothetical protein
MKFKVEIQEFLSDIIEVEADSEDDALAMVQEAYKNENIILDAGHFVDVEFSIYNAN